MHLASCGHDAYLQGKCNHTGCYNAYPTVVPHEPTAEELAQVEEILAMPGPPANYRKRTGHDTLRDLADAPASLRNLAMFDVRGERAVTFPPTADDNTISQADLHRWADAIEEILDFPQWRAKLLLAGAVATGALAGAVAVMVAL
jgi:hypothetical protein